LCGWEIRVKEFDVTRRFPAAALPYVFVLGMIAASLPGVQAADPALSQLEERAFQQAAATADPSIVRIETIGGADIIGEMVAASGPTTGVVVAPDGWIITSSFNFAAKPASIFVTTADGERHAAQEIGHDESRRLTLLKIPAEGLKPLAAVPREEFRVGRWAIALGRTYDLNFPNLAVGIVSALNRIAGRAIQTDANVSPVNYGGPLVDIQGRGLGILVPLSPQGDDVTAGVDYYDSGIGFAIPLVDVLAVLERMKAGETLKAGKLGILFQGEGLLAGEVKIERIPKGSPAEKAGLKPGDVITGLDGVAIDRAETLKQALGPKYGGDNVVVTVRRDNQSLELPVTLAGELQPFVAGFLGIEPARPLKDQEPTGVVIHSVLPGSPAETAELKPGESITAIAGEKVAAFSDLATQLRNHAAEETVAVEVTLNGTSRSVDVVLGAFPETTPAEIAPQPIPVPTPDAAAEAPKTGRFMEEVAGDDRKFWAFVPEQYNPTHPYGLVVWLQPNSESREGTMLESWRSTCEERGLILIGPAAGSEGWKSGDMPYVMGAIEKIKENYHIDPTRIAVIGEEIGGRLAAALASREKTVISGAAMIGIPLPPEAPPLDADHPLRLHVSVFAESPQAGRVERSIAPFREAKYSVVFEKWPGEGTDGLTEEDARTLGRWIDLLGCL
jgi:serine protease Do